MEETPSETSALQSLAGLGVCLSPQEFSDQPQFACDLFAEEVSEYDSLCNKSEPPVSSKLATTAMQRELLKVVFDREVMLLFRLHPQSAYAADWDAFRKRWEKRRRQFPEAMELDAGENIQSEDRKALANRIKSISAIRAAAINAEKENHFDKSTAFYLVTSSMFAQIMASDKAKEMAQNELRPKKDAANGKSEEPEAELSKEEKDKAEKAVNIEVDAMSVIFPEFEQNPQLKVPGELQFRRLKLDPNRLAEELLKPGSDGYSDPREVRYTRLNEKIAKLTENDTGFQEMLVRVEKFLKSESAELIQTLDDELVLHHKDPDLLYNDIFLYTQSVLNLDQKGDSRVARQQILSRQCGHLAHEKKWSAIRGFVSKYSGYMGDAALLGMGGGGILGYTGRKLSVQAATRLSPRLARYVLPVTSTATKAGDKMFAIGASDALMYSMAPSSMMSLYYSVGKYREKSHMFYRNMNEVNGATRSDLDNLKSTNFWSSVGVLGAFSPLFFLGR